MLDNQLKYNLGLTLLTSFVAYIQNQKENFQKKKFLDIYFFTSMQLIGGLLFYVEPKNIIINQR